MKYQVTFECTKGPDKGKKWRHSFQNSQTVVIGRLLGCHIVLTDPKVSQSHCLIQIQGKALCLIDMGSTHGTKVNGETAIGAVALEDGTRISLGKSRLVVHLEAKQSDTPKSKLFTNLPGEKSEYLPRKSVLNNDYALTQEQAIFKAPPEVSPEPPHREEPETSLRLHESVSSSSKVESVQKPVSAKTQSIPAGKQEELWHQMVPIEASNTAKAFCFPRCVLCRQQQQDIYVCRVTGWDYCQNCRELLSFIIEQLALTKDRPSNTTCEIRQRQKPMAGTDQALTQLLQSPQIDIPWQATPYGITIPIRQHGKQMLLYVSRLADSQMAVSLTRLENLESDCQALHSHLYPICTIQMLQRRLLALLPYYPGEFWTLPPQPLPPGQAFATVLTLARAVEYVIEKNGHFGEITPVHIYQEVTGHLFLAAHGELAVGSATIPNLPLGLPEFSQMAFTAPERILHQAPPQPTATTFSLAALLWRLLTAKSLYQSRDLDGLLREAQNFAPKCKEIELPLVRNFFKKAFHSDPNQRYPNVTVFIDALAMTRCAYPGELGPGVIP